MRIPGLIDTVTLRDSVAIAALVADPRLDRAFTDRGPLLNRLVAGRIRNDYSHAGARLPATAARADPVRAEAVASVAAAFAIPATTDELQPILDWLTGAGDREIGPELQTLLARRFNSEGTGDTASWRSAVWLNRAIRATPLERVYWGLRQGLFGARQRLSELVGGDRAGIHATGLAIHNIVAGLGKMRALLDEPGAVARLTPEAAAVRCLPAPPKVLRQAEAPGATAVASWRTGTLVIFDLERARIRCPNDATVFMAGSWSACPAAVWVRGMFETLWHEAVRRRGHP